MGAKILYKDISPTAKLYCTPVTEDAAAWIKIAQLNQDSGNYRAYSSCEHNRRVLNGNFIDLDYESDFGFWSKQMSDDKCLFTKNPLITLSYSTPITFVGLTLTFDMNGNEYATDFNIKYYFNEGLIGEVDYKNTSVKFFTNTRIVTCNKIVIEFKRTNLPHRYLKLNNIDYGIVRQFEGDELMDISIQEDLSLLSTEIAVNTMDFTIKSNQTIDFLFQKKQPLECYFNDELIGVFFMEKATQKNSVIWTLESSDYIGVLDKFSYTGGIFKNIKASVILHDILDAWNIPFEMDASFNDIELSGYLPIASARECVQQVLFACGCVCDTSRTGAIKMYAYDFNVDHDLKQEIMEGASFESNDKVTEVRLTQYDYVIKNEIQQIASGESTGTVQITFSSPYTELSLTGGTITQSGANYAIIEATGAYVLSGKPYEANTTILSKLNPTTSLIDLQNVVEVSNATLISSSNSADILGKLYDYSIRVNVSNIKAPNSSVSVGDYIKFESDYMGIKQGHVISNTFNLNSDKKIVSELEVLEVDPG